jgi:hypothetical protein
MSKQDANIQNVGATEFDYPNDQAPYPHFKAYYGNIKVPHPTNEAAKHVDHAMCMNEVLYAKK